MSNAPAPSDFATTHEGSDSGADLLAFPASPSQEAFFYLEKLFPSHPAFNVPVRFELNGVLDIRLLKSAFDALAARHESLRTRFSEEDGKLLQVIAPEIAIPLPFTNISHLADDELADELNRLGSIEARTPFDLSESPLFRASLIQAAPDRHILQITIHHSVADGWSIGIITDELAEFYNASLENREPRLEPLAIQYADFTVWQREFLESPELKPHLEYWTQRLSGYTELELPTDRPRPPVKSWDGDIVSRILRPSISEKVARISREKGATMFHVFLAAFKAVASRYTGIEDIAVGSPVAGRTRAELEPIIGTFINSVIIRTDLSGDPTFGELVERVRDNATEAIAHQQLPFEQLVKALHPRRDSGRNPLFQINFTHQRDFVKPVSFGGARLTAIPSRSAGAIFDLNFFMVERADGWRASCDFARDLFDRETTERLLGHFETFLDAAAGAPEVPLSSLPILNDHEKAEISQWSGTKIPYPSERSLGESFLDQATRQPARIALTHDKRAISYQLLAASALDLRGRLIEAGVKPGDRVALCAPSVPEMIAAQIAILLTGAACVPLEPDYPAARLRFMIEDSAATVLLTTPSLAPRLPENCRTILLTPLADLATFPVFPEIRVPANAASHIFYTSGSTGTPKGVIVSHRGISRLVLGGGFMDFGPDDSFLQFAPVSFDASTLEIWMPLLHGGRIVLTGENGPSMPAIAFAIREQGVTCLWLTAGLFQAMVDEHIADLKGLRYLLAGGDVLSPPHVRRAFEALPGTTLINGYGPTENTTFTCCHTITRADLDRFSIPIGRPIGNTTVHLLDSRLRPVPVGVPGELFTGGDGLALGYLNHDELTASKFPVHPDHGPLYRTGDLCRWLPDGSIEFLGRRDSQVKIRGFRIELGEIETQLASHPGVRQAKVAVRGDTAETRRIVAWVVPAEGVSPEPAALSAFLSDHLPGYMRPDSIAILDALPLSANGKIDVSALPDPARPARTAHEAPVGMTEQSLAAIWSELLDVPKISRDDDFFALGGHSLMAMRMFVRIRNDLGKSLPLSTLFRAPTIAALASLIDVPETAESGGSTLAALQKHGTEPALFCIHGGDGGTLLYRALSERLGGERPFYALEAPWLIGDIVPRSIEEMAAHYIGQIRAVQPAGPYHLGGYSLGGVVAYEMAQQLRAQGAQVGLVVLFDSYNPQQLPRRLSVTERMEMNRRLAEGVSFSKKIRLLAGRAIGKAGAMFQREVGRIRQVIARRRKRSNATLSPELRLAHIRELGNRAWNNYHPQPYPGPVLMFVADDPPDGYAYTPDRGWGSVAEGLELCRIHGALHEDMLSEPHAGELGNKLAAKLANA